LKSFIITNDDGVKRPGLWALYSALNDLGNILIIAPETAQSSTGMSLTLHKPLRVKKLMIQGVRAYACSGTPSDCVIIGLRKFFREHRPDMLVSGINEGNNLSLQAVYGSGTVAAAVRASLMGIPSIAFSLNLPENMLVTSKELRHAMQKAAMRAREITTTVLEKGFPLGVDYLNVNFPFEVNSKTPIEVTVAAKARYEELIEVRRDPRAKPYIWLKGRIYMSSEMVEGTDAYAVLVNKHISVTPMSLNTSVFDRGIHEKLAEMLGAISEE